MTVHIRETRIIQSWFHLLFSKHAAAPEDRTESMRNPSSTRCSLQPDFPNERAATFPTTDNRPKNKLMINTKIVACITHIPNLPIQWPKRIKAGGTTETSNKMDDGDDVDETDRAI